MPNANEQDRTQEPGRLGRLAIGVARHLIDPNRVDEAPGRLRNYVDEHVLNPVVEDEVVQAGIAEHIRRGVQDTVEDIRTGVPSVFAYAQDNIPEGERSSVQDTYRHIRHQLETPNETLGQRIRRSLFARLLSMGAGVASVLTVAVAERVYTENFTQTDKNRYRAISREWFAYWVGNLVENRDQRQGQRNRGAIGEFFRTLFGEQQGQTVPAGA